MAWESLNSLKVADLLLDCVIFLVEQEILDVIHESSENSSFLRKDTVFARMSFALKTGSFKLVENCIGDMGKKEPIVL